MMSIMTAETYLIVSGKGGVGRTAFFSNLATSLAMMGKETAVMDADLAMSDLGLTFGFDLLPVTLHEVLAGKEKIDRAIYEGPYGVKVVPSGHTIEGFQSADPSNLIEVIDKLKQNNEFLLIDTPPGINEDIILLLPLADHVIFITTPDLPAIADILRMKVIAESLDSHIDGVIINRMDQPNSDEIKSKFGDTLGMDIISVIPDDPNVSKSLLRKVPLVITDPKSPASIAIRKFAADIAGLEFSDNKTNS